MSIKSDTAIYSEKPIATYEAQYRENPVAKPQEIQLTITAESIHGKAFKVEQIATKEEEVYYSRFANKISDISKISINTYIKDKPIYISFITENAVNKNAKDRRRIVIPSLPNPETIVEQIIEIKSKLRDYTGGKSRKNGDAAEAKRLADEEFERSYTSAFEPEQVQNVEGLLGNEEKIKREIDFTACETTVTNSANDDTVADLLLDTPPAKPAAEKKKRPAPIPAPDDFDEEPIVVPDPTPIAEVPKPVAEIPKPAAPIPEAPKPVAEAPKPVAEAPKPAPEPPKPVAEAPKQTAEAPKAALSSMSLDDFESAVKKLKIMHDQGLLTDEEFTAEKRKVLTNLY
ncbi:MAG: SHOCT domain-containing protein [Ruminococcus sp.]|jgi:uncharacterized protein YfkK (UPF0435 family)|nr:SHOCT domain-containing protein [Ruminococcus sp.]